MFKNLPSLLHFQPKFFVGGPARFYLALFYDLVALARPKSIVTLGFGDGEAFFTLCQAVRENRLDCRCVAIFRGDESDWNHDPAGRAGEEYCDEFYGDFARLRREDSRAEFAEESVDLLLINDLDAGAAIGREVSAWQSKLSAQAIVAVHGIKLERADSPKRAWRNWMAGRPNEEFSEGIGLGVGLSSQRLPAPESFFEQLLISKTTAPELAEIYRLAAARIEAQAGRKMAERDKFAFEARKVWMQSLLEDRWKVQRIMEEQGRIMAKMEAATNALRRDRAKAQLVMEAQAEQLKKWAAKSAQLQTQRDALKKELRELKGPAIRRSTAERISREAARMRRRIQRFWRSAPESPALAPPLPSPPPPEDRYSAWIAKHEPDKIALEEQRQKASQFSWRPKISLLIPVHNTPRNFLDKLFASLAAQTYDNWEACIVDSGSGRPETAKILKQWGEKDRRLRIERLSANLGVSENSNRALAMATGELLACVDHDDLLAPFALFEIARAIIESPQADIFYSDEDRCTIEGKRHSPFFKPEWNPELLLSSMYLGHLTAYRRELVERVGRFRKQFELSQDYDLALRATERAKAIRHVPHVLAKGLDSYSDRFCGARATLHRATAAHDLLPGLRNCDRDEQCTSESAGSGRA